MKHHYTYLLIIVILCLIAMCWYGKPEIVPNDAVIQEETRESEPDKRIKIQRLNK